MHHSYLVKTIKFLLYLAPFTLVIVYQGSIFPFIVGKYVFFRTITELALIVFVWAWARGEFSFDAVPVPPRRFVSSPLVYAMGLFVFIFLLATVFGINPSASFWSNFERGEGSLQVLILFIFFLLLVSLFEDESSWRRMFAASLWAAFLVIAYGMLGNLHADNFITSAPAGASFLSSFCYRFAGSLGNPAYVGTYMIFAIFFSLYLFLRPRKPRKKWKFLCLAVFFFIFLLFSQTRGALLGFGIASFAGLIYLSVYLPRGWAKKIVLALVLFSAIAGPIAIMYRRDINITPFCPVEAGGGNRILNISTDSETYQTRLILWSQAIQAWKERPILGWGPENFSTAFEKYYDTRHTAWFDRAHNIFFDYLVFSGGLGLLSFMGIFVVFYIQFFKTYAKADRFLSRDRGRRNGREADIRFGNIAIYERALIFSLPIAYLIQGLVLFDVLPIYINIFLFLAFANYIFMRQAKNTYEYRG